MQEVNFDDFEFHIPALDEEKKEYQRKCYKILQEHLNLTKNRYAGIANRLNAFCENNDISPFDQPNLKPDDFKRLSLGQLKIKSGDIILYWLISDYSKHTKELEISLWKQRFIKFYQDQKESPTKKKTIARRKQPRNQPIAQKKVLNKLSTPTATISRPQYRSRWQKTEKQVELRLEDIEKRPFFGRTAAKKELNEFIDDNNNGLMIVSAPAGSGKSALLADWLKELQVSDEKVAYHFISNLYPSTTPSIAILGSLAEQIRMLQGKDGADTSVSDAQILGERLYDELIDYPKGEKRLILILDGLDEADNIIAPFVENASLPKNVFVIVSARKDSDAFPTCLHYWKERLDNGLTGCFLNLSGLGDGDLKEWLQVVIGDLDIVESDELSTALLKTTDGLPLFLSYVIDDLEVSFPAMANREEMLQFVTSMPAPFPKYIARQLGILAETEGKILTKKVKRLLATLSRTLGPIHKSDLVAALGKKYPNLEMLDHRVSRWLSIGQGHYSFAHPRLARAFAQVLGLREDEVVDGISEISDTAHDAEDQLIDWMEEAWKPQITNRGSKRGAVYALDWLPEHLAQLGTRGESDAARLISDPAFLDERLRQDPRQVAARLTKHCSLWASLPIEAKTFDGARQWTAFWAENETSLGQAAELPHPQTRPFADVVRNCLGDAITSGSGDAPRVSVLICHATPERGLIRSIDTAHKGLFGVEGVLPTPDDGYVSWGVNGAIRFWDKDGTLTKGGAQNPHRGRIKGVLPTPDDGYVSWGFDGAVCFWDKKGNLTTNGIQDAHKGGIKGVLPTSNGGYVSWGDDGAIRFWDKDGTLTKGGAQNAHTGLRGVKGVLPTPDDGYVSWGFDGAVCFWDKKDNLTKGGTQDAHKGGIKGVLLNPDGGYVSWGHDGAIRFWDKKGILTKGGAQNAHKGIRGVTVVLPTPNGGYVSWGHDGAICFWDKKGTLTTRCAVNAHKILIEGILPTPDGGYVGWGRGGAIRFWDKMGNLTTNGVQDAHKGKIEGVLLNPDGSYVSWGRDGAIRFWDIQSNAITGGANYFNKSSLLVRGALPTSDDNYFSWGDDGFIRFWDKKGNPTTNGAKNAHKVMVKGAILNPDGGYVSWGHDEDIRFWDKKGILTKGGAQNAHRGWVNGVLLNPDGGYVSWGRDGAIRFWDKKGNLIKGGVQNTHKGEIEGVLLNPDGSYVSWGHDEDIRFWNKDGNLIKGGVQNAHEGLVKGVLLNPDGGYVSWGYDGAIRFWDKKGNLANGGAQNAHKGTFGVGNVLPTPDGGYVSWGDDRAICFWDKKGNLTTNGARNAHKGEIEGVLLNPDGSFVSWGHDHAIRFWDETGTPLGTLVPPGGVTFIKTIDNRLFVFGRNFWVYPLFNGLPWKENEKY